MECSPKLAAWAVQRSKPYLTKHQTKALLVDTVSVSWKQYEAEQEALLDNESQVNVQLVDLTDVDDTDDTELTTSNTSSDETLFDFTVENWTEPPVYVTNLPATTPDSDIRALAEAEYRKSTTPTLWNRFLTLGQYAVDGFTFDSIMEEGSSEPLKMHCLIWYQYSYHLDQKIDIPPKLQSWATLRSQPFLFEHSESVFQLDTLQTSWKEYSRCHSLSNPWSEVNHKKRNAKKAKASQSQSNSSVATKNRQLPATIPEETSKDSISTEPRGKKRTANQDDQSAASDGKQSVLIPNLNVPVSDGTYRVTLRWKTSIDISRINHQASELKDGIYDLLDDLFDDDDGLLYKWQSDGTDDFHCISKMTPTQVRQYISPSIGILPSMSTIIIPIRFGFSALTPSKWRNLPTTKEKLERKNVTVSFSNCSSKCGKLVIAGYILLKAPMTTHRLRYLQSLRKMLPESTAPFDILLHKKSPSDQLIPHLAVQCGDAHVHSLSESLATILTGDRSALYIPRFVFSKMSDEEASDLFQTHDKHVKSLRWLSLSPMLSNLDRPRKEHNSDGTSIERTTREWARNIVTSDGNYAHFDVVNGGTDQKCYLLFPPHHQEVANAALEEYRKRLYPFTQREARFRSDIGPPPTIHLSKHVIANLEFMKKLSTVPVSSSPMPIDKASTGASSADSYASDTTVSSVSQATHSPTLQDSPQTQHIPSNSVTDIEPDDDITTASTETAPSKVSAGRLSTSSAKIRDLDAMIQRQKTLNDQKDAKQSERVSHLERQLIRISELDAKLEEVQADFGQRLNLFENRMVNTVKDHIESSTTTMDNMNSNIAKLMAVVNKLVDTKEREAVLNHQQTTKASTEPARVQREASSTTSEVEVFDDKTSSSQSHSGSSRSSMSAESSGLIQSPEHKRLRSGRKTVTASIRRCLDPALEEVTDTPVTPPLTSSTTIANTNSFDSLDQVLQDMEVLQQIDSCTSVPNTYQSNPDPESQYTASPITHEEKDNNANPSPGSGTTS